MVLFVNCFIRFCSSTALYHAYAISIAKFCLSGCCSPIVSCHRPLFSYSGRPSTANDLFVTKLNEFMKAIRLRLSRKFGQQQVAPFDRKPLHAYFFTNFFSKFIGKPPRFSPLPPSGRRTRCRFQCFVFPRKHRPELLSSNFLVWTVKCRQRMVKIRTFSQWLGVRTRLIESDPPILPVVKVSFFWQISVIFICKNIPSSTNFFISIVFNHSNAEFLIS